MSAASARITALSFAMVQAASTIASPLAAQAPPRPRFEVASLKERDRSVPLGLVGMQRAPGRLTNRCATLMSLVFFAFDRTSSTPIEGLPGWADTPCSDASTANTYEFQATMPADTTDADVRLMLQAFLAERFSLTFHWENRTLPVFALVIASGGFKLKPTDPKDDPPRAPGSLGCPPDDRACRMIIMGSAPVSQFAAALARGAGRPVIDKTGLSGTYYLDLKWAGETTVSSSLPSLPAALREQFGLELKSDTGPVEVLVIERAERPTPN
jgi:uncharacterized protein (TIGR03435 family)